MALASTTAAGGTTPRRRTRPSSVAWSLAQDGGDNCTIELKADEWFGGHRAYTPAGCPDGFFDVNRWTVSGNQLQLTDTNNRIIGRFWPAGDGRWSGKRESDGARMSLNR
ncbi:AprI/Inh family metalloprotease inhibitor [Lysobacter soli]|uniref:AprI/Inh family metalloprotease inhibitor n=1 Tax=Lysobacter soli TaxID=453783 RepID=UPI001E391D9D|nr:AprI/Inh family metalloprotease inhibitor [Lysobacter soli]